MADDGESFIIGEDDPDEEILEITDDLMMDGIPDDEVSPDEDILFAQGEDAAELPELTTGSHIITFGEDEEWKNFRFTFDPTGTHKLRYKLESSNPNMWIYSGDIGDIENNSGLGVGTYYMIGEPGTECQVALYLSKDFDRSVTFAVTLMPDIDTVEQMGVHLLKKGVSITFARNAEQKKS